MTMDLRDLVSGESDVANFSCLLRFHSSFHPAARCEDPLRIIHANDFVELQQIDVIGLKAAKRFVDLIAGRFRVAAIDFRHEESFLAITIAQSLAHANLALSTVVIPAVVEEVDTFIESHSNEADAFALVLLIPDMVPT